MRSFATLLLALTLASSGRAGTASAPTAAVSSGHPLATRAAIETLRSGGNAIDAVVACAFVLAVADPSSASIGGGGLLLWYDSSDGSVWALDFREISPRLAAEGESPGSLIGVPGFVPGLAAAHERFGALDWKQVVAPAHALALEQPTLTGTLAARLAQDEIAAAALLGENALPAAGDRIPAESLAQTLAQIARDPHSPFRGSAGRKLVTFLRKSGSTISLHDLETYEPVWRAPIRINRGDSSIFAFPPPSGGGVTLMRLARESGGFEDPATLRDASLRRLARMGDPERTRFDLSAPLREVDMPSSHDEESSGGSGIAVVDAAGNAAALVLTLGSPFGSGILTPSGFLMNDSLTDFDATSPRGANAPEPLRRPGTSMSPVIVTRDGRARIVVAAGGGAPAATTTAVFVVRLLEGVDPAEAIDQPRYHHDGVPDRLVLERARVAEELLEELTTRGQAVRLVPSAGEIHAVVATAEGYDALADPRGGGAPGGY